MSKILSICIPSYNMEEYLHRCVDSMLVEEVLDQLEIIIVNDGSKDGTLSIANDYKERHPQSVVVIDKPNGHYGSCINAALKVATGKYFRIVDADDWVDSNALVELIGVLNTLDVDCVCTNFSFRYPNGSRVEQLNVKYNEVFDLNHFDVPHECLRMHNLTFATELLHRIDYSQSEGVCYTDMEYVYFPLSCSQSIYFLDVSLYQYFLGRDGQSVDFNVLVKNNDHYLKVIKKIELVHNSDLPFNENEPMIYSAVLEFSMLSFALPHYILYYKYDEEKEKLYRRVYSGLVREGILRFPRIYGSNKVRMIQLWYKSGKLSRYLMAPFRLYDKWSN